VIEHTSSGSTGSWLRSVVQGLGAIIHGEHTQADYKPHHQPPPSILFITKHDLIVALLCLAPFFRLLNTTQMLLNRNHAHLTLACNHDKINTGLE
jgi:hypothetical protein